VLHFVLETTKLKNNISSYNEMIYVENVAVGDRDGSADYYEDTESLVFGTLGVDNSKMKSNNQLKLVRLDGYFEKMGVSQVDFLKTDIESYDYFALVGCGELLSKCRYIQFELGIGAPLGETIVSNEHYYSLLGKWFDLYILKDEKNPMWISGAVDSNLVILNESAKIVVKEAQKTGVGFNIVGINRSLETDLDSLTISAIK
jgi:FkbM family methyltransferase